MWRMYTEGVPPTPPGGAGCAGEGVGPDGATTSLVTGSGVSLFFDSCPWPEATAVSGSGVTERNQSTSAQVAGAAQPFGPERARLFDIDAPGMAGGARWETRRNGTRAWRLNA